MGLGKMGLGEMGLGEMGQNRLNARDYYDTVIWVTDTP